MGSQTHAPIVNPVDEAAQQIATVLAETEPTPLLHIRRIVQTVGPERALQLLDAR